ncbi:MAG: DUF4595 domain-containing protein [Prevotella sp.]|nr:DUF4595 domain-containing protein [Prevotella sp.]
MKTKFMFILCTLSALALPVLTTSCSDNDDDNNSNVDTSGTPSTEAAVITTDDGTQLMIQSVLDRYGNGVVYTYNDRWLPLTAFCWGDYTYNFTYSSSKALAVVTFEDDDYGYDDEEFTFQFNTSGYISKMEVTEKFEDEYESGSGSGSCTYKYDADGHLTEVSGSYSGKEKYDGDTYNWTTSLTATLTWTNGDLTKFSRTEKDNEDGYTWTELDTTTFEYGSEENAYKQPTMAYSFAICELYGEESELMFTGLFGKGTAMLPASSNTKYTYSDDYDDDSSHTEQYSYTKNTDNTIKTEVAEDGNLYTYAYATMDTRSIMPEWTRSATGTTGNGHKSLMKKLRERRRAHARAK